MHSQQSMPLLALLFVGSLYAATPDPSGHWKGLVQVPGREDIEFEVDLAKDANGHFKGALAVPDESLHDVPLKVAMDGTSINFEARADQPFSGVISEDGKSIDGEYSVEGHQLALSMTRTGDAHFAEEPRSAPISKQLEGRWNGTLAGSAGAIHLVLTMVNREGGTSAASLVNLDEGDMELPAAITQSGSELTLKMPAVGGSWTGSVNPDGTELAGTYRQGSKELPLTFHRTADR